FQQAADVGEQAGAIGVVDEAVQTVAVDDDVEGAVDSEREDVAYVKPRARGEPTFGGELLRHADGGGGDVDADDVVAARSHVTADRAGAAPELERAGADRRRSDTSERVVEKRAHVERVERASIPAGFARGFEPSVRVLVAVVVLHVVTPSSRSLMAGAR